MSRPAQLGIRDVEMFVLDVLRHDIVQLESVLKLLNNRGCIGWREFWPCDFTGPTVILAIKRLTEQGFVQLLTYNPDKNELEPLDSDEVLRESKWKQAWYHSTDSGFAAWHEWEPPEGASCPTSG